VRWHAIECAGERLARWQALEHAGERLSVLASDCTRWCATMRMLPCIAEQVYEHDGLCFDARFLGHACMWLCVFVCAREHMPMPVWARVCACRRMSVFVLASCTSDTTVLSVAAS